jgi:hypothetical protein
VRTVLRCLTIIAAILLVALLLTPTLQARQTSVADKTLLDSANDDRAAAGLTPLKWDPALAKAAHQHALRMAHMNQLSHQFPGEPSMQDRARQAGARFSMIAENVAQGPTAASIHTQWMNSPPHRANLLDPELKAVGISVVQSGSMLFAVEDFSAPVPELSLESQEQEVASQLGLAGFACGQFSRRAQDLRTGTWQGGPRPSAVLRYETADLTELPSEVQQKVSSGKYQCAAVGACDAGDTSDFARFRVAILLY